MNSETNALNIGDDCALTVEVIFQGLLFRLSSPTDIVLTVDQANMKKLFFYLFCIFTSQHPAAVNWDLNGVLVICCLSSAWLWLWFLSSQNRGKTKQSDFGKDQTQNFMWLFLLAQLVELWLSTTVSQIQSPAFACGMGMVKIDRVVFPLFQIHIWVSPVSGFPPWIQMTLFHQRWKHRDSASCLYTECAHTPEYIQESKIK